ncbi:MAG TPA: glycogen-binding domain-containing protein, partial [Gemmatimonadaceae bacterium]|nr:glycogen-binding domain-containing protein [Gemmatimonadaceae bacterium]
YSVSDGVVPSSVLRLTPNIQYNFPHAKITARGSAYLSDQQLQIADGIVSGTFTSPTVYGVRAEMIGNASRAMDDRSLGTDQVDVQTRVHVLFRTHGGMWLGGGVARPWRVAVVSSAEVTDVGAWGKLGDANTKFGIATLTTTFTNFSFSKTASVHDTGSASLSCAMTPAAVASVMSLASEARPPLFSESPVAGACARQSRFSDLEAMLRWEVGAFELSAAMGHRFGDSYDVTPDSRRWTSANATLWLNERVAIIGGGGRQPALPLRGLPARSFWMTGLQLAYAPISKTAIPVALPHTVLVKSFEMRSGNNGMQKIVIHVGGVETVDVMGDFSDWSPLTLVRRGRDLWELALPLSAGMHQINVRVDGGQWVPPPGMPTMRDGYNGEVGLLVVPK